jgi:hypothetical protein
MRLTLKAAITPMTAYRFGLATVILMKYGICGEQ